jgi:hypothetical protein
MGATGMWAFAYGIRDCGACGYRAANALISGGWIGAAIGLPFDLRRMSRPIFSSPGGSAAVTISPMVSAQRQGVMATIRF